MIDGKYYLEPPYERLHRKAETILRNLVTKAEGDPDKIAAILAEEGIVGEANIPERCPLALYVADKFEELHDDEEVIGVAVQLGGLRAYAQSQSMKVYVPFNGTLWPLAQFVVNVDDFKYPDIVLADYDEDENEEV